MVPDDGMCDDPLDPTGERKQGHTSAAQKAPRTIRVLLWAGSSMHVPVLVPARTLHHYLFQPRSYSPPPSSIGTTHRTVAPGLSSRCLRVVCSRRLRLPVPSPVFESKDEAQVRYDHRLHVDTHLHTLGGRSDNMLCVSARMATFNNWRLLDIGAGESTFAVVRTCATRPHCHEPRRLKSDALSVPARVRRSYSFHV